MRFLSTFFNLGAAHDLSISNRQRIRMLNKLVLIVLIVTGCMVLIDLSFALYVHSTMNAVFFVTLLFTHRYLHRQGHYEAARMFFITMSGLFLSAICILTISQQRPTEVENIILSFSAVIVFLLYGKKRLYFFIALALAYFALKTYKFILWDYGLGASYILMLINSIVAFAGIYVFSNFFGREFRVGLEKSERLTQKMKEQRAEHLKTKLILSTMINNLPVILSMVDKTGHYMMINDSYCEALDKNRDEILGRHYTEVLPANIFLTHGKMISDALNHAKEIDFQEETILPDGRIMQSFGKYFPILNEQGEVEGMTSFVTDITEVKNNEKHLERLVATKNKLFSVLAHELKSPIFLLSSSLEMWKEKSLTAAEMEKMIPAIERKLMTLTFTMENIMTWAKSQFEGFKSVKKNIVINDIIAELVEKMAPAYEEKSITVHAVFDQKYEAYADESHIQLLYRNFLSNAIKFTSINGEIRFHLAYEGMHLITKVTDTGIGIQDEMLHAINSGQNTASVPGTEQEVGTGIGLVICKELLDYNNGSMQMKSEPGKGTTVTVILQKGL